MALRHPYRHGDVVVVELPFSNALGQKTRPAIVISNDVYHDDWDEILVVAVTSRQPKKHRPTDAFLHDWHLAGLLQPSWARGHLATVHRRLVRGHPGRLTASDLLAVEQTLRDALGI